jgi:hypothetical protein
MSLENLIAARTNMKKRLTVGKLKEILKDVDDDIEVNILINHYMLSDDTPDVDTCTVGADISYIKMINYKDSETVISLTCIPNLLNIGNAVTLFDNTEEDL